MDSPGRPQVSGCSKISIGTKITNLGEITQLKTNSSYSVECSLCQTNKRLGLLSLAVSFIIILSVILIKIYLI